MIRPQLIDDGCHVSTSRWRRTTVSMTPAAAMPATKNTIAHVFFRLSTLPSPNGPATQRRGPLREMVTHLGCRDVAGHVRCRRKLGDGSSPAFSGEAMPWPAKPSTRRSGKNVQLRMTDLPPNRPSDGVGISSTDDVVQRITAHRRRARPKDSPSSFLR